MNKVSLLLEADRKMPFTSGKFKSTKLNPNNFTLYLYYLLLFLLACVENGLINSFCYSIKSFLFHYIFNYFCLSLVEWFRYFLSRLQSCSIICNRLTIMNRERIRIQLHLDNSLHLYVFLFESSCDVSVFI